MFFLSAVRKYSFNMKVNKYITFRVHGTMLVCKWCLYNVVFYRFRLWPHVAVVCLLKYTFCYILGFKREICSESALSHNFSTHPATLTLLKYLAITSQTIILIYASIRPKVL